MFRPTLGGAARALLLASVVAAGCGREPAPRPPQPTAADSTLHVRQRIAALEAQRSFGDGELQRDLLHPDARVRRAAVVALGRIQDAAGLDGLLPLLSDPDSSVVEQATFAIGQLQGLDDRGRHAAQEVLVARLDPARFPGAAPWVAALGKLGGPETVNVLSNYVATGILAGNPEARPPLVEGLAALGLARIGTPKAIAVLADVGDMSQRRTEAAWRLGAALGTVPDSALVRPLLSLLDHPHKFGRALGAWALGKQHDRRAVRPLLNHLADLDWEVRATILVALGNLSRQVAGDPEVLEFCAALASDANPLVREAALVALDSMGAKPQARLVREALHDAVPAVRRAALRALARAEKSGALAAWQAARHDSVAFVRAEALDLARFVLPERAALDTLLGCLREVAGRDRAQAASALGDLPRPPAAGRQRLAASLTAAMQDPDFVVAASAAEAAGKLRLTECAPALSQAYAARGKKHEDVDVRLAAVSAASELAGSRPRGAEGLRALLERARGDADERVARAARTGLARLAGGAEPPPLVPRARTGAARLDSLPAIDLGRVRVKLVTAHGEAVLELDGDRFPRTVGNFLRLVDSGFYARGVFHRVVPAFVVQGGCPRGDGWGDPGWTIPCEYGDLRYDDAGVVGMAHAGKDTGGSQFFITHLPVPRLDGRYTAFGRVVQGMEVVNKIVRGDRFSIERVQALAER